MVLQYEHAAMFDALSHPTRIRILRLINSKPRSFAELKHELGLVSSGHLQHHLGKLTGLVTDDGRYVLTVQGIAALKLAEDSEKSGSSLESVCSLMSSDDESETGQIRLELDHVHIRFQDSKRTTDFYKALGFKVQRVSRENGDYVFIALNRGQIAPTDSSANDEISIGLVVDPLDMVYHLAKKHDVEIVDDIKDRAWGPRSFYIRDPNGYLIEFEQAAT